ncbi:HIT family protein [Denitratisoma sp. DHT3]|uniref:HIT family protein n=1 Tax=Denitratisoma sp. DHT3 TaxID=1981880 RepID=UPI0011987482|nr:HIT family protein [Denitratisoma sp. DHT3]QDX81981.1 HIT family protein [Denitratisoma sp. DHT3]
MSNCDLCLNPGGELLWQDALCRVIRVEGAEGEAFPGFCRVVWHAHVREMSDLSPGEQRHLLNVVLAVELALRGLLLPDKINLASLGNAVPHLHWHVIPRWTDDSHFPAPIWASPRRPAHVRRSVPASDALRAALERALAEIQGGG